MGLQSLPVAFGVEKAKWICVGTIDITQIAVALALYAADEKWYSAVLMALIVPQVREAEKNRLGAEPIFYIVSLYFFINSRFVNVGGDGEYGQVYFQLTTFLQDPIKNDVKYQASAQPFLVFGIPTTALACGHHHF